MISLKSTLARRALFALVIAWGAVATGCRPNRARAPGPRQAPTYLVVENRSFVDYTVFAVRGGQRMRLGLAQALTSQRFRLPDSVVGAGVLVTFLGDPVGSSRMAVSQDLVIHPGEDVRLSISP